LSFIIAVFWWKYSLPEINNTGLTPKIPKVAWKLIFQPPLNGRVYVDWRDDSQQNYQLHDWDDSQL
jgi:hypothetical protein